LDAEIKKAQVIERLRGLAHNGDGKADSPVNNAHKIIGFDHAVITRLGDRQDPRMLVDAFENTTINNDRLNGHFIVSSAYGTFQVEHTAMGSVEKIVVTNAFTSTFLFEADIDDPSIEEGKATNSAYFQAIKYPVQQALRQYRPSAVSVNNRAARIDADVAAAVKADGAVDNGGIELDANHMQMTETGDKAAINLDPAMIERFKQGDFTGITPVIISVTPLPSLTSLLNLRLSNPDFFVY